jgi:hypothetical protein
MTPGGSWLATGFTLAALLAIGVLVASVRNTGTLPNASGVTWEHYAPDTRAQIDQAYINRDCVGLQRWFTSAAEADAGLRASQGNGAMDLLVYVDQALDLAGCY